MGLYALVNYYYLTLPFTNERSKNLIKASLLIPYNQLYTLGSKKASLRYPFRLN